MGKNIHWCHGFRPPQYTLTYTEEITTYVRELCVVVCERKQVTPTCKLTEMELLRLLHHRIGLLWLACIQFFTRFAFDQTTFRQSAALSLAFYHALATAFYEKYVCRPSGSSFNTMYVLGGMHADVDKLYLYQR